MDQQAFHQVIYLWLSGVTRTIVHFIPKSVVRYLDLFRRWLRNSMFIPLK